MSYTRLLYHIIFRTKYSCPSINEKNEKHLYRYIWKFCREKNCVLYQVNGMPDHIHLLVGLHSLMAVGTFVQLLKNATHLYIEQNQHLFPEFYAWAKGYCALTYSEQDKINVIRYIANQKEHHKKQSFVDEAKQLLVNYGISIDETFFERNL